MIVGQRRFKRSIPLQQYLTAQAQRVLRARARALPRITLQRELRKALWARRLTLWDAPLEADVHGATRFIGEGKPQAANLGNPPSLYTLITRGMNPAPLAQSALTIVPPALLSRYQPGPDVSDARQCHPNRSIETAAIGETDFEAAAQGATASWGMMRTVIPLTLPSLHPGSSSR
jgi:hypothetical protein